MEPARTPSPPPELRNSPDDASIAGEYQDPLVTQKPIYCHTQDGPKFNGSDLGWLAGALAFLEHIEDLEIFDETDSAVWLEDGADPLTPKRSIFIAQDPETAMRQGFLYTPSITRDDILRELIEPRSKWLSTEQKIDLSTWLVTHFLAFVPAGDQEHVLDQFMGTQWVKNRLSTAKGQEMIVAGLVHRGVADVSTPIQRRIIRELRNAGWNLNGRRSPGGADDEEDDGSEEEEDLQSERDKGSPRARRKGGRREKPRLPDDGLEEWAGTDHERSVRYWQGVEWIKNEKRRVEEVDWISSEATIQKFILRRDAICSSATLLAIKHSLVRWRASGKVLTFTIPDSDTASQAATQAMIAPAYDGGATIEDQRDRIVGIGKRIIARDKLMKQEDFHVQLSRIVNMMLWRRLAFEWEQLANKAPARLRIRGPPRDKGRNSKRADALEGLFRHLFPEYLKEVQTDKEEPIDKAAYNVAYMEFREQIDTAKVYYLWAQEDNFGVGILPFLCANPKLPRSWFESDTGESGLTSFGKIQAFIEWMQWSRPYIKIWAQRLAPWLRLGIATEVVSPANKIHPLEMMTADQIDQLMKRLNVDTPGQPPQRLALDNINPAEQPPPQEVLFCVATVDEVNRIGPGALDEPGPTPRATKQLVKKRRRIE